MGATIRHQWNVQQLQPGTGDWEVSSADLQALGAACEAWEI